MAIYLRPDWTEVTVLVLDESGDKEPEVTVRVEETGEERTVGLGMVYADDHWPEIYRSAEKRIS